MSPRNAASSANSATLFASDPLKDALANIQNASPLGSKFAVLTGASATGGIDEQFAVPSVQRPTDRPSPESVNAAGRVVFGSFADAVTAAPAGTAVAAAAAPTTTAIVITARVRLRARRAPSLVLITGCSPPESVVNPPGSSMGRPKAIRAGCAHCMHERAQRRRQDRRGRRHCAARRKTPANAIE